MLPRQASNTHKYEVKRKNSIEEKPKLTGLQAIMQNQEQSKVVARPQTAASSKIAKPKPRSGIPGIGGAKPQPRTKARTDPAPQSTNTQEAAGQDRIRSLLKNNPNGAAASMKRETDGIGPSRAATNVPSSDTTPSNVAKNKLDQSIKNAYKLRMKQFEDSQANDIGISSGEPSNGGASKPIAQHMQSPNMPSGDHDDFSGANLEELKSQHERLVDLILKEEDQLIANHHKSINSTISSVKEQEQLRHKVDLPGSDVEEYLVSLDQILSERLSEIEHLHRSIQSFHKHIKQEQNISQKFYEMQDTDQVEVGPEDY